MPTHVLRGTKQEIVDGLTRLPGNVREAIVFVDEAAPTTIPPANAGDVFAEMRPYMVDVDNIDDSRAAIYSRLDGE